MRWARETQGDAPRSAQVAIEFLKSDIEGIAQEFDLLAKGVIDDGERDDAQSVSTVRSRSIPVYADA
jgi:hypothetical protein